MRETVYIRISAMPDDPLQWLIVSNEHHDEIASGELTDKDQLVTLQDKIQGRDVKVLIDSTVLGFRRLKVPGKNDRAIRAATPYMIEEELAQDVETVFFAYASRPQGFRGDDNCFVVYVSHQQMATWLSWFNDAEIKVRHFIPDVLCLPRHGDVSVVAIDNQYIVRFDDFNGCVVNRDLLPQVIDDIVEQTSQQDDEEPRHLQIDCYSPVDTTVNDRVELVEQSCPLPLLLLAQHSQQAQCNLLQNQYHIKDERPAFVTMWLKVAAMAVLAVILTVVSKVIELNQLQAQQAQIGEQIKRDYMQAFPQTKRVRLTTLKRQMQNQLAATGASDTDAGFLAMLVAVQPAFENVTQIKPNTMRFDGKRQELRLSVVGKDYQSFEKFKQQLEAADLEVKVGAQNNQGDLISGSFSIRSKA
ncbi:type II secretion system protein GspL [Thalassotalea ponticola]|uniref:type II secretion system protein GspL n=1 Tax=Thalassotalea ponticola TaxID=1523392 RepID=UPI0025B4894F|nr:type II secretion system protein GspL [Thalassotalea ponticola]MDN3653003.1 type II secretion system protein GspL [Thalassotalea ponticola]